MTDYAKIQTKLWHDPRFRALSERGRLLFMYLLSCPHRNLEGLFVLPVGYASADLGWEPETVAGTIAETVGQGLIAYDETVALVFIVDSLRYQAPANPNMVTAALNKLEALPDSPLLERFYADAQRYAKPLAERLPERFTQHQTTTRPLPNHPPTSTATPKAPAVELAEIESVAGSPSTPPEVHAVAMVAAGYTDPPIPTGGELRTIEQAIANGHDPVALADVGNDAAAKDDPKAWILAVWHRLANSTPRPPTVDRRPPEHADYVPDPTPIDTDAAPGGLADARAALKAEA